MMKIKRKGQNMKHKFRFTLGAKITIMFSTIIIIMLIPLLLLLVYSNNSINRYDQILSNINKIEYLKVTTDAQPQRIISYCTTHKKIEDSGEGEMIAQMIQYISDIKFAIGDDGTYAQNLEQAVIVENLLKNYLQKYREGIGLCGSEFSLAGDSQFYTMNDIAGYISENCSTLLNLEMRRTADIQQEAAREFDLMRINIVAILCGAIIVAVLLVVFLQKGTAKPIRLLSKKLAVIAEKDLTDTVVKVKSKDEIGDLAYVFNAMSNNLKEVLGQASSVSTQIENSFQEVTDNVESNAKGSENISRTVRDILDKINTQNEESRMVMNNISDISEISGRIQHNAENILVSANHSINGADQGNQKLEDYTVQLSALNDAMQGITQIVNELTSSTQQMNEIVNTISDISDETNLLSLNASIEAARAGEAGRGFAVVAVQIQKLADSSKDSAAEIGNIITNVQTRTMNMADEMKQGLAQLEKGNAIAQETKESFEEIKESIAEVDVRVQEIVSNVQRLLEAVTCTSRNMDTIDVIMQDTSQITQGIADTVNTQTANLEELTATMTVLSEITEQLKATLEQFKL